MIIDLNTDFLTVGKQINCYIFCHLRVESLRTVSIQIFSKVFDKTFYYLLLNKIHDFGVGSNLVSWIGTDRYLIN